MRAKARAFALVAALALAAGRAPGASAEEGGGTPGGAAHPPGATAPPLPRASWVLEPPRIRIGDVAQLELVVVTPPDHRMRPVEAPPDVKGFWLLGVEALPIEREPTRWIHRTRVRIRARDLGVFLWPAQEVVIEGPDGARSVVAVPGDTLEVASVLPEHAGRTTPFGLRAPRPLASGASPLAPAALGALAALAAVGLVALVRRERGRRAAAAAVVESDPHPDVAATADALAALAAAASDTDVRRAADAAASALKRWAAARFRAPTSAATTPELRAASPPFAMRSRWPAFLDVLEALDAGRFPPHPDARAAELRAGVARAEALVRDGAPGVVAR